MLSFTDVVIRWAFRVKPKSAITDLHPEEEDGKGGYWHIVEDVTIEHLVKKGSKKNTSRPSGRKSKGSTSNGIAHAAPSNPGPTPSGPNDADIPPSVLPPAESIPIAEGSIY